jgi:hypothetical protein
MELISVIAANAIRFLPVLDETKPKRPLLPLVRALQDRYFFLEVPKTVADYNLTNGVTFLEGVFRDQHVINRLQVFARGLICDTKETTNTADEFLDDVLDWADKELKLDIPDRNSMPKLYLSQLEVRLPTGLGESLADFSNLGRSVSQLIQSYGMSMSNPFEVSSFKMYLDVSSFPGAYPFEFSFERRAGEPYSSNTFFSSAPLKTQDHLQVLQELEDFLRRRHATS